MSRASRRTDFRARGGSARTDVLGQWQPVRIGSQFEWLDDDHILMSTGPLAGREFGLKTEIKDDRASVVVTERAIDSDRGGSYALEAREQVGQCLIERNPRGVGVELWDIGVRPRLRRGGLCAAMTWVAFRSLLTIQQRASFRVRVMTSVRPDERTMLQNTGICVVASRLGMTSDFEPERFLAGDNLIASEIIPARDDFPPGLKLTIRSYPLVLTAVALDPDTQRPSTSFRLYQQLEQEPEFVRDWAQRGLIVVSNGSYSLREGGVDRFVNVLAIDADEAAGFRERILPLG